MLTDPEATALSSSRAPARAEPGVRRSFAEAWSNQGSNAGREL